MFSSFLQRELVVVTGKGGVGKSVFAAALARELSRRGRRVLAVETDPRENLHQMLGVPPSGGEVVGVAPGLYLQNLRPRQVLDEVVKERLKVGILTRRVLSSTVYHHFVDGAPGLKEMAVLGHAFRHLRGIADGPEIDTVVLDAPATGHGVTLLAAPSLVVEVMPKSPFVDMATDLANLVGDEKCTAMVVVTLAEEMPVQEALELRDMMADRLHRVPELLVINGLYPPCDDEPREHESPSRRLWRLRRRVNEREISRLQQRWQGARIELPLLPLDRGPALIEALGREMAVA